jgi:hypothetical protein
MSSKDLREEISRLTKKLDELDMVFAEISKYSASADMSEQVYQDIKNKTKEFVSMREEIETKKKELEKLEEIENTKGGRKNGKRKSKTMKGRNKKGKKGSRMVLKSSRKTSRKR